jgi:hypothetical protein
MTNCVLLLTLSFRESQEKIVNTCFLQTVICDNSTHILGIGTIIQRQLSKHVQQQVTDDDHIGFSRESNKS